MMEKKIFNEIPGGKNKFHSAILTTFSLDFHHFEYQVLRTLRKKWIANIGVFVDQHMLEGLLGISSGDLKQISQSYSINGIRSKGAFHPKINFLIGDDSILMFFGSGNITTLGHGKNHELFTGFYSDSSDKNQLPLLKEGWQYIQRLAINIKGYSADRVFKIIPKNIDLASVLGIIKHKYYKLDDNTEAALLYNDETNIFEQLLNLIPAADISLITVVAPYYDDNGEALLNMVQNFTNAKLEAYVPNHFGLPPTKMLPEKKIQFYQWENTLRAANEITGATHIERRLHSKIFHFKSREFDYCLIGSANATIAGLGSKTKKAINEEFCVLYKVSNRDFLNDLGINGNKVKLNPALLKRDTFNSSESPLLSNHAVKFFINSADMEGSKIKVFINASDSLPKCNLLIYNDRGDIIIQSSLDSIISDVITIQIKKEDKLNNPCYVAIQDIFNKIISNKQIINNVDKLYNTDPSKSNRTVNRLLSEMEVGVTNEFTLIDYLIELDKDKKVSTPTVPSGHNNTDSSTSDNASDMTYFEAKEAAKDGSLYHKIHSTHNGVRIFDAIIDMFNQRLENDEDELIDEEEEGTASVGKDRKEDKNDIQPRIISDRKEGESIINKLKKLCTNYNKTVNRLKFDNEHKLDSIDLVQFLLVTYFLTKVSFNTKFEFGKNFDEKDWKTRLKNNYYESIKELLNEFTQLVIKHKKIELPEDDSDYVRFSGYLKTSLYKALLYNYVLQSINTQAIDTTRTEDSLGSELEINALNLFEFLGKPGPDFEKYMINFSQTNDEISFNPMSLIHNCNSFLDVYNHQIDGKRYFKVPHSGICLIIESGTKSIKYRSAFPTNTMKKTIFEKHLKSGNAF